MINREIDKAKKAYDKKDYRHAAEIYAVVAEQISEKENPVQKAELKNNSSVAWLLAGNPEAALTAALGTDLVFEDANDPRRQAMALGNQAAAYEALGQLQDAIEKYQSASVILKDINDDDLRAYVLQNLAALQLRTGDQFQAVATMHTALEKKKKLSFRERFLKKVLRIPFKNQH